MGEPFLCARFLVIRTRKRINTKTLLTIVRSKVKSLNSSIHPNSKTIIVITQTPIKDEANKRKDDMNRIFGSTPETLERTQSPKQMLAWSQITMTEDQMVITGREIFNKKTNEISFERSGSSNTLAYLHNLPHFQTSEYDDTTMNEYILNEIFKSIPSIKTVVIEKCKVDLNSDEDIHNPKFATILSCTDSVNPKILTNFGSDNSLYFMRPYKSVSFDLWRFLGSFIPEMLIYNFQSDDTLCDTIESIQSSNNSKTKPANNFRKLKSFFQSSRAYFYGIICHLFHLLSVAIVMYCEIVAPFYERLWSLSIFGYRILGCGSDIVKSSDTNYSIYFTTDTRGAHTKSSKRYANNNPIVCNQTTVEMRWTYADNYGQKTSNVKKRPNHAAIVNNYCSISYNAILNSPLTIGGFLVDLLCALFLGIYSTVSLTIVATFFSLVYAESVSKFFYTLSYGLVYYFGANTGWHPASVRVQTWLESGNITVLLLYIASNIIMTYYITNCLAILGNNKSKNNIKVGFKLKHLKNISLFFLVQVTCFVSTYILVAKFVLHLTIHGCRTLFIIPNWIYQVWKMSWKERDEKMNNNTPRHMYI